MAGKNKADIRKREILEHFYEVLSNEGLEGASIAKIAKHMGVHPSLLIHYFKTKEEMIIELVDFMIELYWETYLSKLREIQDPAKRLDTLLNILFGLDWTRLVDDTVFYACYYLSFRNKRVKQRLSNMYNGFKELLIKEIKRCTKEGIIKTKDPEKVAILIISLSEGVDFYENICGDEHLFEELGQYLKGIALMLLEKDDRGM